MKISDLVESPAEIKFLINIVNGKNVYSLRNNSIKVKKQFQELGNTPMNRMAMKYFLGSICDILFEISQYPQWNNWLKDNDGKMVARELDKIYDDNITFMNRFP